MTAVLVVDSVSEDRDQIVNYLEQEGFATFTADDTADALRQLYNHHPDALVYSADVTRSHCWAFIKRVHELCRIPIILVASFANRGSLERAFNLGVEGYLVKPLIGKELLGRLVAILGRSQDKTGNGPLIFRHELLIIDWKQLEVRVNGRRVHLTPTEFKLLSLLVQRRGWVLSRDEILSQIWGPAYLVDRDLVKLYIWSLRRKIEPDPAHPRWIITKYGIGYTFSESQSAGTRGEARAS